MFSVLSSVHSRMFAAFSPERSDAVPQTSSANSQVDSTSTPTNVMNNTPPSNDRIRQTRTALSNTQMGPRRAPTSSDSMRRTGTGSATRRGNETNEIDVVNKLQNTLSSKGRVLEVPLPMIVVQGGQSSGKSSVLESFVGRELLPRGTGTITRRPTILQLQPSDVVYAQFAHRGNEKFFDFERVKQEIMAETMRHPGPTGFSSDPITLKVFAPNVLKLTLVDLPGQIRNPTPGMPERSKEIVENMILDYITPLNTIILAVSPANQDIATSDAIEMARTVDPRGERTLCVLTKLDLMDAGTDARGVLENRDLPLTKGYIGVINRSQADINNGKSFEASLQSEKSFFENHPAYRDIANKQGSPYLQKTLQSELIKHIRKTLPAIRKELFQKLSNLRKELKKMDKMMGFEYEGVIAAEVYMQRLVHQFIDEIQINLFGHSQYVSLDGLKTGAIINYLLNAEVQKVLKLPAELTEEELMILIGNEHGTRNILAMPTVALEAACGAILDKYNEPLEGYVDSISSILIASIEKSCLIVKDYPALKEDMSRYINEYIDIASERAKDLLGKYLETEKEFCNIHHWNMPKDKWEGGLACSPVIVWNSDADGNDTENEEIPYGNQADLDSLSKKIARKMMKDPNMKQNWEKLGAIVTEYIRMIQKQIADVTLKKINCFLVKHVSDFIKTELMIKLSNSSNKDLILEECEEKFHRRNEILELCADLEETLVAAQAF